jgi:hypothetical protein
MKKRSLLALAGLVFSFAVPAFTQRNETPDPLRRAALVAFETNEMEAWNSNDADKPGRDLHGGRSSGDRQRTGLRVGRLSNNIMQTCSRKCILATT